MRTAGIKAETLTRTPTIYGPTLWEGWSMKALSLMFVILASYGFTTYVWEPLHTGAELIRTATHQD